MRTAERHLTKSWQDPKKKKTDLEKYFLNEALKDQQSRMLRSVGRRMHEAEEAVCANLLCKSIAPMQERACGI